LCHKQPFELTNPNKTIRSEIKKKLEELVKPHF
jgi:hypothetical protein